MSNIPKLRFPEFSGEWEEKNFYEVFDILQNNTFSRDQLNNENGIVRNIHYGDVLIKYGDYIDCQKEKLPFINLENNLSKYEDTSYVKNGDIIIADTAEDYTAGKVTEICNVKDYKILSGLHTFLCRTKFEFASKFLGYKLNSSSYHNQIAPLVAGTKVYSINRKAIGETTITYPSKAEQQKIADFLSNVDSIITEETKILNTLHKKKKALMQKLFTQQLRFKSANGTDFSAWEEKKLGECVKKVCVGFVGVCEQFYTDKYGIPMYRTGNLKNGKVNKLDLKYVTKEFHEKNIKSQLQKYDILIARHGENGQASLYNYDEQANCLNIVIVRPSEELAFHNYLINCINSDFVRKEVSRKTAGSTQSVINTKAIEGLIIPLPCLAEQQKIADCLSSMDSLIQTQQKVVTTWQQRKKALLQQMFV